MKTILLVILLALNMTCSSANLFQKIIRQENSRVAILPFSGKGISRDMKYLAADEWSDKLFVLRNIPVVDRSQVNSIIRTLGIENTYFLSRRQLSAMSDSLEANIIALGSIIYFSHHTEPDKSHNYLSITLRFLEGHSGRILFMIQKAAPVRDCSFQTIAVFLQDMSEDLEIRR